MDDNVKQEIEKLIREAFHKGDLVAHRQYHEEAEDRALWHKKLWRKLLERAAMAALTVIGGWAAYALWVAFKHLVVQ